MKSPVTWMSDEDWAKLPIIERAMISAHVDVDIEKVREVGGNNRGPRVREYLKSVGLGEGYAWCAAFVTFHLIGAGLSKKSTPLNPASACNWLHNAPQKDWEACDAERGAIGGWCDSMKWQGHLFFVVRVYKDRLGRAWIETLEGNTGPDGGRDGDGAYRKNRRVTSNMRFIRMRD